jgi:hypothetical protein
MISEELKLEAFTITSRMVAKLLRQGMLPHDLSDDDVADVTLDAYAYVALPRCSKYDPERGSLYTFLYTPLRYRIPYYAWKIRNGGINTTEQIQVFEFPVNDGVLSTDGEQTDEDTYTLVAGTGGLGRLMAYEDAPEGLEPPPDSLAASGDVERQWRLIFNRLTPEMSHKVWLRYGLEVPESELSPQILRDTQPWRVRRALAGLSLR